jgi:hypothetical protein
MVFKPGQDLAGLENALLTYPAGPGLDRARSTADQSLRIGQSSPPLLRIPPHHLLGDDALTERCPESLPRFPLDLLCTEAAGLDAACVHDSSDSW